jgi:CRISPR/Cas system CMR-associated protein Cmr5 small subunit
MELQTYLQRIDKNTYKSMFQEQIDSAENSYNRVRRKIEKLSSQLMGKGSSSQWYNRLDYTSSHYKRKCEKISKISNTIPS